MAEDSGEVVLDELDDNIDELAGSEMFEVPDDLDDDAPAGAQTEGQDPDPATQTTGKQPPAEKPRDETGKFVKDAPATEEGQPPEPPQAEAAVQPGTAAEPEPELEFSFRSDGRTIQIPGSRVTADGIFIPKDVAPDFQRLLSHGVTYQGSYKQRLYESAREKEEMKAQIHENVERADAFLNFFVDMLDRTERNETDQEGRSPLEAWLDDFRQNRVKLEAQAELAVAKAYRERKPAEVKLEGFDDPPAAEAEVEVDLEQLSQELAPQMGPRLQDIMKAENIAGLSGGEVTAIRDFVVAPENIDRFFRRALQDISAAEWGGTADIKAGQLVALDAEISKFVKYQAGLILNARKSGQELKQAEQKNARSSNNQIPPTTAVAGNGTPPGNKPVPKFKNKEEMEAWFAAEDALS
jgi:hypothetical protein